MAKISESENQSQMHSGLIAGTETLSANQVITFTKYIRHVLPADGYIFWVKDVSAPTVEVQGSLHYSTDQEQREDETIGINRVILTTDNPIQDFNTISNDTIYLGEIDSIRFAFNSRGKFYQQAGLCHYLGDAVYPAMLTQIIDSPTVPLNIGTTIATNSLPIWLGLNGLMPVYPAFLLPSNLIPPYAAIDVSDTVALQSMPYIDGNGNHYQLVADTCKVTIYGARANDAFDFQDYVINASLNFETFGIQNMPVIKEEKRTQSELGILANKKSFEIVIDYDQSRILNIAQKQIASATCTLYLDEATANLPNNPVSGQTQIITNDYALILHVNGNGHFIGSGLTNDIALGVTATYYFDGFTWGASFSNCAPMVLPQSHDFGIQKIAGPSATPYTIPAPTTTYQTIFTNPCGILRKRIDTVYSQSTAPVYATWNPADKSNTASTSNSNLTVTSALSTAPGSGLASVIRATQSLTSGKWSWQTHIEVQPTTPISPAPFTGSLTLGIATSQSSLSVALGNDAYGWAYWSAYSGEKSNAGAAIGYGLIFNVGDWITTKLDLDLGTLRFEVNGVDQGVCYTGIVGTIYPAEGAFSNSVTQNFVSTTNFGATPFPYPVPAGYNAGVFYTGYYLNDHVTWTYEQV